MPQEKMIVNERITDFSKDGLVCISLTNYALLKSDLIAFLTARAIVSGNKIGWTQDEWLSMERDAHARIEKLFE